MRSGVWLYCLITKRRGGGSKCECVVTAEKTVAYGIFSGMVCEASETYDDIAAEKVMAKRGLYTLLLEVRSKARSTLCLRPRLPTRGRVLQIMLN